jgi:hypothetical protein
VSRNGGVARIVEKRENLRRANHDGESEPISVQIAGADPP